MGRHATTVRNPSHSRDGSIRYSQRGTILLSVQAYTRPFGSACGKALTQDSERPHFVAPALNLYSGHRQASASSNPREFSMLSYAVIFFIIALVAAALGYGGIASSAAGIAKILFFVFLAMAIVSFVLNSV